MAATGTSESVIRVWSLRDKPLRSLKGTSEYSVTDFEHVDDDDRGREPHGHPTKRLVGHSGPVFGVCFSPDQKYLISGSEDGTARLWSMDTFSNLVAYRGHNYPIWDVDFGPFGVYFATASHDRTARLWSCEHVNPLRIFTSHLSDVDCVKFHPNSNYLLTGSSDRTVRMWDIHRGKCVRVLAGGHPTWISSVCALATSRDGQTCASAGDDGSIVLWDLGTGSVISSLKTKPRSKGDKLAQSPHYGPIYSLDFSADGHVLASGGSDGYVRVWDIQKGTLQNKQAPLGVRMSADRDGGNECNSLIGAYMTKRTPVHQVKFTHRNLLMSAGPFIPYP